MTGDIKDVTKDYISLIASETTSSLGQERIYNFAKSQVRNLVKNKNLHPALWSRMYSDFTEIDQKSVYLLIALLRAAPSSRHAEQVLQLPLSIEAAQLGLQAVLSNNRLLPQAAALRRVRRARNASLLLASHHAKLGMVTKLWKLTNLDQTTPAYDQAFLTLVERHHLLDNDEITETLYRIRNNYHPRTYSLVIARVVNARPEVIPTLMSHQYASKFVTAILDGGRLNSSAGGRVSSQALTTLLAEMYESDAIGSSDRYNFYSQIKQIQDRRPALAREDRVNYPKDDRPEGNLQENQTFIKNVLTPSLDNSGADGWNVALSLANGWTGTLPDLLDAALGAAVK